jgi:hypothetical protein
MIPSSNILFAIVVGHLLLGSAASHANEIHIIKNKAYVHATHIRSMQFSYELQRDSGWKVSVAFYSDGTRFRVDRNDITGYVARQKQFDPVKTSAAYNDERYQLLEPHEQRLRLQDGNLAAGYSVNTPHLFIYQWVQQMGAPFRWDTVLSIQSWDAAFENAMYIGKDDIKKIPVDVIDLQQAEAVRTPCVYRVYFASALGYFPIKYERRVKTSGEVTSTMTVEQYEVISTDGRDIVFPTLVRYVETGADGVSLPKHATIVVDKSSIRVNQDVDDSLFTLPNDNPEWVYDVDEQNRLFAATNPTSTPMEKPSPSFTSSILVWFNAAALCVGIIAYILYRRRARNTA